jgi:hypothetical protein
MPLFDYSSQSQRLIVRLPLTSPEAKPALSGPDSAVAAAIKDKSGAFVLQVLDLRNGQEACWWTRERDRFGS